MGGLAMGDIVIGGNVGEDVAIDTGVGASVVMVSSFGMRHFTLEKQLYPLGHGCHRLHVLRTAQFAISSA